MPRKPFLHICCNIPRNRRATLQEFSHFFYSQVALCYRFLWQEIPVIHWDRFSTTKGKRDFLGSHHNPSHHHPFCKYVPLRNQAMERTWLVPQANYLPANCLASLDVSLLLDRMKCALGRGCWWRELCKKLDKCVYIPKIYEYSKMRILLSEDLQQYEAEKHSKLSNYRKQGDSYHLKWSFLTRAFVNAEYIGKADDGNSGNTFNFNWL